MRVPSLLSFTPLSLKSQLFARHFKAHKPIDLDHLELD